MSFGSSKHHKLMNIFIVCNVGPFESVGTSQGQHHVDRLIRKLLLVQRMHLESELSSAL